MDPETEYARFLVWPDSFDVYLAAREITEELNVAAGWELRNQEHAFQRPLVLRANTRVVCNNYKEPAKPKSPQNPPAPDPALEGRKVPPRDIVD